MNNLKLTRKYIRDLKENEYYDYIEILKKSFDYNDNLLFYGGFKIIYEKSKDIGYFLYNNNEMIGICIINSNNNTENNIIKYILLNYAIKDEYRNLKYGSKFFDYIIKDLENYINEIYLNVYIDNKKAYNIYIKNGFEEIKNEELKKENKLIEMKKKFNNIKKRNLNILKNIEKIEINIYKEEELNNISNDEIEDLLKEIKNL